MKDSTPCEYVYQIVQGKDYTYCENVGTFVRHGVMLCGLHIPANEV
jgi:hypothetical protein